MEDKELQAWVEWVSLEAFGIPFRHRATFNRRLTSTGGRYFLKSHNIDISAKQLEIFGPAETEKIIRHELCHYHLHLLGMGYRHRDADFKEWLARSGGSRHCRPLPGREQRKPLPFRYKLVCTGCRMEYKRKRKVDPARYRCGKCRGKLVLTALDSASEA
ncbi:MULTISPECIES: SprT family protein [unclassified Paenibacillus]|uniref:SprT family protein n=1 Tax=unclassified Paenibacillus TaxID=185978 RepID=UPI0009549E8E|nr:MULTISPECIES: SprT family protein [unclassified Paenibacillus]ASS66748.1 SprT family protein [Paenibacillus sp. RUD330]SIP96613.1 SprT-like protein [Paenibacillus sp. RU4X]SIQ15195.1 SprT-like protein [Paenibacillus sp. RU4T]